MGDYEELQRLEDALEMSDREWRTTFDAMSDAVWVLDSDSRIVKCNKATAELFGVDPSKAVGRRCWEVLHSAGGPIDMCPAAHMKQTLKRESAEIQVGVSWFQVTVDPIVDETHTLTGIVHIMRDITDRKRAEDALKVSETKYRRLYDSLMDAYVTIEMDGTISECNESYRKMLGYEPGELEQSTCEDLTPEKWHVIEAEIIEKQLLCRGYTDVYEKEYRGKDGTVFPVELRAFVLNDEAGEPCGMWAIVRDITERKRTDDALRESEEKLKSIFENAPIGIFQSTVEGRVLSINQAGARLYGYNSPEEAIESVTDVARTFYADPKRRAEVVRKALESEGYVHFENEYRRKDGSAFFANLYMRAVRKEGQADLVEGFVEDITERKRTDEALRESEQTYRNLVETTDTGYLIGDTEGRVVDANAEYVRLTGRRALDEILGHAVFEWTAEYDRARNAEEIRKCAETGMVRDLEIDYVSPDGRMTPIEINATVIETLQGPRILTLCRDITERRLAEEELTLNEARLNALVELSHMTQTPLQEIAAFAMEQAVRLTKSAVGYVSFVNEDESVLTMHSWSRHAMEECNAQLKPLVYPLETTGLWGEAIRQRRPVITNDYAAPNPWKKGYPEGHIHIIRHMNVPVFDGDHIVVVAGVGNKPTDYDESDVRQLRLLMGGMWRIVKQHQVEQNLWESEEKFRTLFESANDAIFIMDHDRLVDCNEQAVRLFGCAKSEMIGRSPDVFAPQQQPDGRDSKAEATEKIEAALSGNPQFFEWVHMRLDGTSFYAEVGLHAIELQGRTVLQAVVRDVTDRKRAESEKRAFYRQTILSVTEGKLDICDAADVELYVGSTELSAVLNDAEDMARARRMVAAICAKNGLTGSRQEEFTIAAGEAITNAIKHGGRGRVFAGTSDGEIWVAISDSGRGIDSLILPNAVLRRGFSTKPSLGLGYTIMLEVADRVLLCTGPAGTTVVLFKNVHEPTPVSLGEAVDTWEGIQPPS